MPAININDLNNAKLDSDTIAGVATSTAPTVTDRLGNVKATVFGAVQTLKAFNVRGAWVTATAYALKDVYTYNGYAYVVLTAHISTTVAADTTSGYVTLHQGATKEDLAAATGTTGIKHQDNLDAGINTVFSILRERVKLTQYTGYAPDGTVDVTSGILKAVSRIGAKGGVIECAAGSYKMSANITLSKPIMMEGEGANSTTFLVAGDGYNAFTLASSYAGMIGVGFDSSTNIARNAGSYISIASGGYANRVKNFAMANAFMGISLDGPSVITTIEDGVITNTKALTGIPMYINGGNDTLINRMTIDNSSSAQPLGGIYIRKTDAVWMSSCDVLHSGHALTMAPEAGEYISWCFFSQCAFDTSSGNGIYMNAKDQTIIKGTNFVQCWSATVAANGVAMTSAGTGSIDGTVFDGHRSLNNGNSGYYLTGTGVINTKFESSIAAGNSATTPQTNSGFDIGAGVRLFSINNCISGASLRFPATQARGILINAGGSDNFQITNNQLYGNGTPMLDASTGQDKLINNNIGMATKAKGIATIATGTNSITVTHGLFGAPQIALVSPFNSNLGSLSFWTGGYTSTTFTITTSAPVTSNTFFTWQADIAFN